MHRTTVSSDIALLKAAGFEIMAERKRAWNYYLSDRTFSLPELKVLIDAVQSSKFITEKKSRILIEKLISLTSETNAGRLKRTVHITDRAKSENEKGYYIVDAINEAMNNGVKISFYYFDYDGKKKQVLRNGGKPYTISPYDLIWDGDFYYVIGYCDDRNEVRTFRVDRIKKQPSLLRDAAVRAPKSYNVHHYTNEVFRMFNTDTTEEVYLVCDNDVMKFLIDKFGKSMKTETVDDEHFKAKVQVCVSPTFFAWVFGFGGKITIEGPTEIKGQYKELLMKSLEKL